MKLKNNRGICKGDTKEKIDAGPIRKRMEGWTDDFLHKIISSTGDRWSTEHKDIATDVLMERLDSVN